MRQGLSDLPYDLIETIVSYIDAHRDLISLSLANKALYDIIIPRHSQYRLVRTSLKSVQVWSHLASRPDLTRNIRILHIKRGDLVWLPDRYPVNMAPEQLLGSRRSQGSIPCSGDKNQENVDKEAISCQELCRAINRMQYVQEAAWTTLNPKAVPVKNPQNEEMVLDAIVSLASLNKLRIVGNFGNYLHQQTELPERYPVGTQLCQSTMLTYQDIPSYGKYLI
jgi:hypothetical protein